MTIQARPVPSTSDLPRDLAANPKLSRWVTVSPDGTIDVRVGKVELGQGIRTALAQIAADELDVELTQIRMVAPNTATGPDEGSTSGSMSILHAGSALRLVCANVRALFLAEAAETWGVAPDQLTVDQGRIRGSGSANETSYAELAASVTLDRDVDAEVPTKDVTELRVVGVSAPRLDLPDKVAGLPRFIHDLRLPGTLFGRVVRPPSPGALLDRVDAATLAQIGPDITVVRDGSFLGVVGPKEADVMRAVETLRGAASWHEHETLPDEHKIGEFLRAGPHDSLVVKDTGEPPKGARTLRASYSRPFLAHASMAPSCGVARWEDDGRLSVWSHSQGIFGLRDAIAQALDLPADDVVVEHVDGAGCYGHNAADDAAFDAVLLARAVPGRPVHVQWSRRDELAWAPFGSAMASDVEAHVDDNGHVVSWSYDVYSQGHTSRPGYAHTPGLLAGAHLANPWDYPAPVDPPQATGGGSARNAVPIYDFPHRRITAHRLLRAPLRTSALRALGSHLNVFAIESFMDELALAAGADPLDYRLAHLTDERGRVVLEQAAALAGWATRPQTDGIGHGIGFARYKDKHAYCAVVAEVEAESEIRVRHLWIAVDVGQVVNPDGVRNQIEGGATQATSWTIKERVRFDRTRVTSDDWESYPILRFSEAPDIEVDIVSRPDLPSVGAGEAAQGPTSAAIANAVSTALGVRVRDLPLTTEAVVAAIESADA